MHSSGITVSPANRQEFAQAQQSQDVLFLQYVITANGTAAATEFKLAQTGRRSGRPDFDNMRAALSAYALSHPGQPCFLIARPQHDDKSSASATTAAAATSQWILIFFMPDEGAQRCSVRDRMLYASSVAALKDGLSLGASIAQYNLNIQSASECTLANWLERSRRSANAGDARSSPPPGQDDRMTPAEQEAAMNEHASARAASSNVRQNAIVGVPVVVDKQCEQAIKTLASSTSVSSSTCLIFKLDTTSHEKLVSELGAVPLALSQQQGCAELQQRLAKDEPRYALVRFIHSHDGKSSLIKHIFIYHCPEAIKAKLKMLYSTCKAHVLAVCAQNGVTVDRSIEVSDRGEINDALVLSDLYPQSAERKVFAKPQKPGRGPQRINSPTQQ